MNSQPFMAYYKQLVVSFLCTFLFYFTILAPSVVNGESSPELETWFTGMLKNADLKGSWAPVSQGNLGTEKSDGYHIVRVEKKEGDQWVIVTKAKRNGQEFEYPMPATIKFAGDTAVLILNDVRAGDGKTWSARVLFHDDVYAGSWWGLGGKKGTVSGTIQRR